MRWPVPASWEWRTVGDVAKVVGGGTPRASDPANFDAAGVPWITPADLSGYSSTYIEKGSRSLSEQGYSTSGARLLPARAVLFSSRAPIGYCVIARNPVATNQGFKSLVLTEALLPEFVRHYLLASKRYIEGLASGTTFKEISGRRMTEVAIPVPPLHDQHHIVAAIETHFSRLDAAVASLSRAKANVKRARASVLKAAVEGRLVPTEAQLARTEGRDYEPASVLLERILAERKAAWVASGAKGKYKEPVQPEAEGLPELPGGWCWATVAQIAAAPLSNGKSVPSRADGFPVLRLTAMNGGRIRFDEAKGGAWSREEATSWLVEAGDFLVMRGNGSLHRVGSAAIAGQPPHDVAYPDTMIRVRPQTRVVLPSYLLAAWSSHRLREQIEGSARTTAGIHKVNQGSIEKYVVPVAPIPEQDRIAAEVDRRLSVLDALDTTLNINLARCARLRQSILQRAFEGRLQTDTGDENREPSRRTESTTAEMAAARGVSRSGSPSRRSPH